MPNQIDFEGFLITVGRDAEDDRTMLVSIDTRDAGEHCHNSDGMPRIRINLNDGVAYDHEAIASAALKALYEWVQNNVPYGLAGAGGDENAALVKHIDDVLAEA